MVALVKSDKEHYIFLYEDEYCAETIRTLGKFASNPKLSFTWHDAAILSSKIREMKRPPESERFIL